MCTAISFKTKDHYFGRNLDLEYSYYESVVITPRNYNFCFTPNNELISHLAIIGMAYVCDNYPLYYDATNEAGLSMAGLNFPDNAAYYSAEKEKDNIAPYELIPWVLTQCKNTKEARTLLKTTNIVNKDFRPDLPSTPLHWLISDDKESIVVESTKKGMEIYDNCIGVLTNNPPFPYHQYNLSNYMNVTSESVTNRFSDKLELQPYSRGMGGIGLPGDLSSASRFIRAAFARNNSVCDDSETSSVHQFFHILNFVEQTRGCAKVNEDYEITIYSSCCNTTKGIYYYKTYNNSRLTTVYLHHEDLNSNKLISYPLRTESSIFEEN